MNWLVAVYGMVVGACAWLAGAHLLIWLRDRRAWAQLAFGVTALAVIAIAALELSMMLTRSAGEYGRLFRWLHLAAFVAICGNVAFVHFYLGTGRKWLAIVVVAFCALLQIPNFTVGANNSFSEIRWLLRLPALGENVSAVGAAVPSPMMPVVELAHAVWLAYVIDAAVKLWRRGGRYDRRRALWVGGCIALIILLTAVLPTILYLSGFRMPLMISLSFALLMVVLGFELSDDVARAARVAAQLQVSESALRESEQRLALVVEAADLVAWVWDLALDEVWVAPKGRALFGFAPEERIDRRRFFENVHPEDRATIAAEVEWMLRQGGQFTREYRRVYPDGRTRWISGRGRAECDASGKVVRVRGVSVDVTARVEAEEALGAQRRELAHLSRIAMLGELTGSLAHELSQPLASILGNVEVAQSMIQQEPLDREEFGEILSDIATADRHASAVISRVRTLLRGGEVQSAPVAMNEVVTEVLRLMRGEILDRGVEVETQLADSPPLVRGDRVQFQQVLLNLVMNGCDAMSGNPARTRRLTVRTEVVPGPAVRVSVSDVGCGIAHELREKLFEPFQTTKAHGLGLGLSVSRSIIAAHGGTLTAMDNERRGSIFHFTVPASVVGA